MTSNAYQIIANNGQGGPSGGAGADSPGSSALNIIPEQEITHGRKIGSGTLVSDSGFWPLPSRVSVFQSAKPCALFLGCVPCDLEMRTR